MDNFSMILFTEELCKKECIQLSVFLRNKLSENPDETNKKIIIPDTVDRTSFVVNFKDSPVRAVSVAVPIDAMGNRIEDLNRSNKTKPSTYEFLLLDYDGDSGTYGFQDDIYRFSSYEEVYNALRQLAEGKSVDGFNYFA